MSVIIRTRKRTQARDLTSPEPSRLLASHPRSERRQGRCALADYSDDPDDNTGGDIQDVTIDYELSEETKPRGERIEQGWHK